MFSGFDEENQSVLSLQPGNRPDNEWWVLYLWFAVNLWDKICEREQTSGLLLQTQHNNWISYNHNNSTTSHDYLQYYSEEHPVNVLLKDSKD